MTPTALAHTALPSVTPLPTATPQPRALTVCLGSEPQTLYPYGAVSLSTWNVLEAVYDGPIDRRGYALQPVIVQKLPNLTDGDAVVRPVVVKAGQMVLDTTGSLAAFSKGVKIFPSGCSTESCAVTYDGKSEMTMDQLEVTFKLLPGLTWSDGSPLTAADSVYSFKLASDPATPVSKTLIDRTASYAASGDQTVVWTGIPGYLDGRFASFLWLPLPEHAWGKLSAAELLQAPLSSQKPLGWGAFMVQEWVKGDHITLVKNPAYFRAGEGLPWFDMLVFRFPGSSPRDLLTSLLSGECDLLDHGSRLEEQLSTLQELQRSDKLKAAFASGPEWEQLVFGIKPASYDDGYNAAKDRPAIFDDVRTRQAFANCIDRQGVVDQLLLGLSPVAESYLPAQSPLFDQGLKSYVYDPTAGARLLDEVGWKDEDNNPATPRVARGVKGVPDGTLLKVTYHTTQASLRKQVSAKIAGSLAGCGIQADIVTSAPADLFAPGPLGPIFGRQFDLVQFSWESSLLPQCFLFQTSHIPTSDNRWIGDNITGLSSPEFDDACSAALRSLPGQAGYAQSQTAAQQLFHDLLPAVPLYQLVKAAAARKDLCGFSLDPSARSDLGNVEAFNLGTCK